MAPLRRSDMIGGIFWMGKAKVVGLDVNNAMMSSWRLCDEVVMLVEAEVMETLTHRWELVSAFKESSRFGRLSARAGLCWARALCVLPPFPRGLLFWNAGTKKAFKMLFETFLKATSVFSLVTSQWRLPKKSLFVPLCPPSHLSTTDIEQILSASTSSTQRKSRWVQAVSSRSWRKVDALLPSTWAVVPLKSISIIYRVKLRLPHAMHVHAVLILVAFHFVERAQGRVWGRYRLMLYNVETMQTGSWVHWRVSAQQQQVLLTRIHHKPILIRCVSCEDTTVQTQRGF